MKSMFYDNPKNKYLARVIKITSVADFKKSVKTLVSQKSYDTEKYRALLLARNRCKAALKKKNLHPATRKRFQGIVRVKIPKPKKTK